METNPFPEHLLDHRYCTDCPYYEYVSPSKIPGGVPHIKCHWLEVDDDPLLCDGYKICQSDFNGFAEFVLHIGGIGIFKIKNVYGFVSEYEIKNFDSVVKRIQERLEGFNATIYYGKYTRQGFEQIVNRVLIHFDTQDDENMFLMQYRRE